MFYATLHYLKPNNIDIYPKENAFLLRAKIINKQTIEVQIEERIGNEERTFIDLSCSRCYIFSV
jgi:hypothetical protein